MSSERAALISRRRGKEGGNSTAAEIDALTQVRPKQDTQHSPSPWLLPGLRKQSTKQSVDTTVSWLSQKCRAWKFDVLILV